MTFVPIAGPSVTDKEVAYVAEAAANAWYEKAGSYANRFETQFSEYVGRQYAISLPSCTSGIHLALLALGIGPGDEVIVPDITWIATSAPVNYVGATVVYGDIDPTTWCLSADSFEALITDQTRAVIPVNIYGSMPDFDAILEIGADRGIAVIEDAAESIGSEFHRRRAGGFGTASVFSFHGSKTLVTGEGGMLVTDDEGLLERMQVLRDHGRSPGDTRFFNQEIAHKYRMSDLQAAFGLAQLSRIEELVAKKRRIFSWYTGRLKGAREVLTLNAEPQGVFNSYWMVTAILDSALGITKEWLGEELRSEGIGSRPFFHPLSSLPAYRDSPEARRAQESNTTSYRISPSGINLPSALKLTEDDIDRVCATLLRILDRQ